MSSRYDDEQWTPGEFAAKLDSEGGVEAMLRWGGPGCFPPELREGAETMEDILRETDAYLHDHPAEYEW